MWDLQISYFTTKLLETFFGPVVSSMLTHRVMVAKWKGTFVQQKGVNLIIKVLD